MIRRAVYLAGPEVFLPDPVAAGAAKRAAADEFGFEGLYPLDNELPAAPDETPTAFSRRIYAGNIAMMERADFGIFNLTPFRGPSADAGTVFELGLMTALRKPVFGYTNVAGDYRDRVAKAAHDRDALGHSIEAFGNADNLMIDGALDRGDFQLVRVEVDAARRWDDLDGFRRCLAYAQKLFGASA